MGVIATTSRWRSRVPRAPATSAPIPTAATGLWQRHVCGYAYNEVREQRARTQRSGATSDVCQYGTLENWYTTTPHVTTLRLHLSTRHSGAPKTLIYVADEPWPAGAGRRCR